MNASIGEQISVCLLTYNHADVIESTLQSILDQSVHGYEVIVSDDCSSDTTWERVLEIAAGDHRVRPIQTPRNLGMAGNANFAVAQSARQYIALLHHDDLYRRDLLEQWAGLLAHYPDIGFVYNSYGVYGGNYVYTESIPSGRIDGPWLLERHLFPRWGCPVRGTAMIRREAWEELGGMREQFGLLSDIDLWMRLAMHRAVGYVQEPLITVRHDRPSDYPEIYKGEAWSWQRQRFLFDIHADNRREYYKASPVLRVWKWWLFRFRVSFETAKWLAYAILRRKRNMIDTSADSATPYDQLWLRMFRRLVRVIPKA